MENDNTWKCPSCGALGTDAGHKPGCDQPVYPFDSLKHDGGSKQNDAFRKELESLLNRYSKENGSSTPDFVLCDFLIGCLMAFDKATVERASWYGRKAGFGLETTK